MTPATRFIGEFETVYFVAAIDNEDSYLIHGIKVGIAADPAARLKSLQVANPHRLELFGQFDAETGTEAHIHTRLSEHRIQGEWFRPDDEVLDLIEEYLNGGFYVDHVVLLEDQT